MHLTFFAAFRALTLSIFGFLPTVTMASSLVEIDPVPLPAIPVDIVRTETGVSITWEGTRKILESSNSITGPWARDRRSRSPHTEDFTDEPGVRYFRVYDPDLYTPRPTQLRVPDAYSDEVPTTLVVSLHGFSATPDSQEQVMPMLHLVDTRNFLYLTPAGLRGAFDGFPQTAWNDGGASSNVDDVGFIVSAVREVQRQFNVDPNRIYVAGMSNGGFLALRAAYEHNNLFAGVISQGGGIFRNMVRDTLPENPVHVLVIHSLADEQILYAGGRHPLGLQPPLPTGVLETLSTWATYNRCDGPLVDVGIRLDLHFSKLGDDTSVMRYTDCDDITIEHWRMENTPHVPSVISNGQFSELGERILDWIDAHPKPTQHSGAESAEN